MAADSAVEVARHDRFDFFEHMGAQRFADVEILA